MTMGIWHSQPADATGRRAHVVAPGTITAEMLDDDLLIAGGGVQGPPGMTWRGAWLEGVSYAVDDAVFSGGSSYICTAAHAGHQPPNATYWDSLAERGATWYSGSGVPSLVVGSKAGDYYLDTDTGIVYQLT